MSQGDTAHPNPQRPGCEGGGQGAGPWRWLMPVTSQMSAPRLVAAARCTGRGGDTPRRGWGWGFYFHGEVWVSWGLSASFSCPTVSPEETKCCCRAQTVSQLPHPRGTPGPAPAAAGVRVLPPQMLPGDHPSPTQAPSRGEGREGSSLGSAGEGAYREAGVAGLDPELSQHPDAVGELQGLVEHVLTLHVPLGDGEDVAALEFAADGVCVGGRNCCGG